MSAETPHRPPLRTGMARSLLREIAERLEALARTGEASAIDLRSLPMTAGDRKELKEALGSGDVAATLDVAGRSEVWETRFAGVWWLRHFGDGDHIASEVIEIARVPDILSAHPDDMRASLKRLNEDLAAAEEPPATEETGNG
ncbi:hydrogenase expression/formation C-terminal domain-containing protein [Acidimangrovimonas pyrenivorans]|uniref:Hydrogenase expression/formation C-terminal domain-containing protein n=1 Tax=Acidimangrovimonas pyrenivorans TaxID=2030798 RepID=A0ABV7AJR9_9RHOB